MSRPGTPTDNAMMESFMGKLKNEEINHHEYKNLRDLEKAIEEYKDYYHNKRLKQSIGYKTIKEFKE
jgi:putative transposase